MKTADILTELKDQQQLLSVELQKIEAAITAIEGLPDKKNGKSTKRSYTRKAGKGVYEGAVTILASKKTPMKNRSLYDELIKRKIITKKTPIANVMTTLYKAVKEKGENCKIKLVSKGEWGLASWK